MSKLKKIWIIITILTWLICCQGLFVLIQTSFGEKIIESTQGQLRQELDYSDFNFLARSITDYTTSGSIRCVTLDKIAPEIVPILDLKYMGKRCHVTPIELEGTHFDVKLKSLNGDIYRFQFISNNPFFFNLALWGFRLLGLLSIMGIMLAMHFQSEKKLVLYRAEIEVANKIKQIALQVSHDIRSPLAALKMAIEEANSLPADYRNIIFMSVQRINDIANNLLNNNNNSNKKNNDSNNYNKEKANKDEVQLEAVFLAPLVDSLVSEKRMSLKHKKNISIEFGIQNSYGLFAAVNAVELSRVLSNLVNNAAEAMESSGKIIIKLQSTNDFGNSRILLSVTDNGKGMPEHILKKLGEKGFSHGKTGSDSGNGLGFSHAIETIKSFNGELKVESIVGIGTTINIFLPRATTPSWFVKELLLSDDKKVLILDDEESMLKAWAERLPLKALSFTSGEEFSLLVKSLPVKNFIALIDYELQGQVKNGLDIISSLEIEKESILVTSRFEEKAIRDRCEILGVRLIPKMMAFIAPINYTSLKPQVQVQDSLYDYVYIDDEEILRIVWEGRARKQNFKLLTLSSTKDFYQHIDKMSKEHTQIYVDSNLGKGEMAGEEFLKILHEEGYKHLAIASGYEAEHFKHLNWLKYSGKNCPF